MGFVLLNIGAEVSARPGLLKVNQCILKMYIMARLRFYCILEENRFIAEI